LRELTHGVAVLLGTLFVNGHGFRERGVKGRDQDSVFCLNQMDTVTLSHAVALEHRLGNGRAGGVPDGTDGRFLGHSRASSVGYNNSSYVTSGREASC